MDAKEVNHIFDTAIMGQAFTDYDHYRDLVKARAAVAEAYERLDALERECEGLRADAERYRWLRKNCVRDWVSEMPHDKGAPSIDIDFNAPGSDIGAAIDALRLTGTGEGT